MRSDATLKTIGLEWPRVVLVLLAFAAVAHYMIWRLDTINPELLVFSWVLYGAEAFGVVSMLLHLFMTARLSVRVAPEPEAGVSVDVFIPTINEPLAVIRRTALTAINMDYPHKTWILDDGHRAEVKALAEEIGCGYLSRTNNLHAKAGNLNYALDHTDGALIAIFDADHAPKKNFLTHTLGYFRDAKVAFVQTPQDFYNLDSYQHRGRIRMGRIWTEQSLFFRVIQRGKDAWNAAFFCGSCAIIRREALMSVGGFASGTVTEDIHTSIRLHKAGFRSVYHAESLVFGIAAAQVEPFLKQRIRWGQGAMQVWRKEGVLFARGLTLPQRICYIASILTYFEGWQKGLFYFTPAIVLATGLIPIATTAEEFLIHFVPYLFMSLWAFNELGRGYSRVYFIEQYNMARFGAFCYATFGLFRRNLRFKVTNKLLTGKGAYDFYLVPHYLVLILNVAAIPVGAIYYFFFREAYMNGFAFSVNLLWAGVNLAMAGLVLAFSLSRGHYLRRDYRFAIPMAAALEAPNGETLFAAVDDVSSAGMLLVASQDIGVKPGDIVGGTLRLPGEVITFRARVRTVNAKRAEEGHTIGCELLWDSHAERHRLELFLYGSDLEWQVHHITERTPTLIERVLAPLADWKEIDRRPAYENDYDRRLSMLYAPMVPAEQPEPGVLAINGRPNHCLAMVFTPFASGATIEAKVFVDAKWQRLKARVVKENKVEHAGKPLYFYDLDGGLLDAA